MLKRSWSFYTNTCVACKNCFSIQSQVTFIVPISWIYTLCIQTPLWCVGSFSLWLRGDVCGWCGPHDWILMHALLAGTCQTIKAMVHNFSELYLVSTLHPSSECININGDLHTTTCPFQHLNCKYRNRKWLCNSCKKSTWNEVELHFSWKTMGNAR